MGLQTRGKNIVVTSGQGVLVHDIADAIIDGYSIDWLTKRFPVSEQEIWEVVDYYADKVNANDSNFQLDNVGGDTEVDIEVSKVSDSIFFGLIAFGKLFYPNMVNFKLLFTKGLEGVIIEICNDLLEDSYVFEASDLHALVYNALETVLGGKFDPNEVLEGLPVDHYNSVKGTIH